MVQQTQTCIIGTRTYKAGKLMLILIVVLTVGVLNIWVSIGLNAYPTVGFIDKNTNTIVNI